MKRLFQNKCSATYGRCENFTIDVHRDYIEYYIKLKNGHLLLNLELFSDGVEITAVLGNFWDDFMENVMTKTGIGSDKNPMLCKLIAPDSPYKIVNRDEGKGFYTTLLRQTDTTYPDFIQALASEEIRDLLKETADFLLSLHNELAESPDQPIRHLVRHFHD